MCRAYGALLHWITFPALAGLKTRDHMWAGMTLTEEGGGNRMRARFQG
jgi:hypothetical protein